MPQKNSVKLYHENGYYHVYNRGVEQREIFLEKDDYIFFLYLLKTALLPPTSEEIAPQRPSQGATLMRAPKRARQNFFGKIILLSFNLMPNHYHFLVKQNIATGITEFIRSVSTTYVMYFNKKYKRVGSLFQGIFKAIDIDNDNYLLWLTRYIHRNSMDYQNHPYSSSGLTQKAL